VEERKIVVKTIKAALITAIVAGLALGVAAQATEHPGEKVDTKSLPTAVQQTINQQAAGGEVVAVKREDDPNGKWNYEVVVRTSGKEWGFEVDPNGKFLKKHTELRK
jgi:uncharacterized membrane protein YkoI